MLFAGVHGPRDLREHVSVHVDAILELALRKVDHELVGDVLVGIHRIHPLQEKDFPSNLIWI